MIKSRRKFLVDLAGTAAIASMQSITQAAEKIVQRPNIVFFLVDDLGWGDFGCYGDTFHETPHIDHLAREGMKFTNAYTGAPVCSPSRAAILTGRSPARLHLTQWLPGTVFPHKKLQEAPIVDHLPLDVPTIARQLKGLGYKTAAIGKWHLGGKGYLPENFGFDVNIAGDFHGNPPSYFGPYNFHNLTGYSSKDYLTEVLTGKMQEFLGQAAHPGPFFLYMAEYAVHIPLQEREALIAKYRNKIGNKTEPDPVYAAMVESVDTALGALRQTLVRLGVADNTIIIVTSDNGGVGFQAKNLHRIADNGPLRAGKGFLYEGGIRTPLIVHWPRVTKPGSICEVPVVGTDTLPTILSMVGTGPVPQPCDGVDITGLFRGEKSLPRAGLCWHYPHYSDQGGTPSGAIREGDWKLIEFFEDNHVELYNLAQDPGEQYNFASSFGDKAYDLQRKLQSWRTSVNAAMPSPNASFAPKEASLRTGPAGCSWDTSLGCRED